MSSKLACATEQAHLNNESVEAECALVVESTRLGVNPNTTEEKLDQRNNWLFKKTYLHLEGLGTELTALSMSAESPP